MRRASRSSASVRDKYTTGMARRVSDSEPWIGLFFEVSALSAQRTGAGQALTAKDILPGIRLTVAELFDY